MFLLLPNIEQRCELCLSLPLKHSPFSSSSTLWERGNERKQGRKGTSCFWCHRRHTARAERKRNGGCFRQLWPLKARPGRGRKKRGNIPLPLTLSHLPTGRAFQTQHTFSRDREADVIRVRRKKKLSYRIHEGLWEYIYISIFFPLFSLLVNAIFPRLKETKVDCNCNLFE